MTGPDANLTKKLSWPAVCEQHYNHCAFVQYATVQGDSRSPFVRNFLISQNRINMKIRRRL
jgi:hypothetical protein